MSNYRQDIKLIIRYIILAYVMYICYYVIQPETIAMYKDLPGMVGTAVIGSPYAALTLILKYHFDTTPKQDL